MAALITLTLLLLLLTLLGGGDGELCNKTNQKTELDRCLSSVAPYMPKVGLPHTTRQLTNMCRAFKGGMECVDAYTSSCLTPSEQQDLRGDLEGARSFLAFLCDDPVFQKEYLSYGGCLRDVSDDWERCHRHYKFLIRLQHKFTNVSQHTRDRNVCCIRGSLLSCVYSVAKFRCGRHQALFVKKVTATLSYNDVQEVRCRNVTLRTCAGAPKWRERAVTIATMLTLLVRLL